MARVWCVWSGKSEPGPQNLRFGVRTSTWGLPRRPATDAPRQGDFVLFGQSNSNGNARLLWDPWSRTTATLLLGEVTGAMYLGTAPHWPNEVADGSVKYPYRFGFVAIGKATGVELGDTGPLDRTTSDKLRTAVGGDPAYLSANADITQLMARLGLELNEASSGLPSLAATNVAIEQDDEVDAVIGAFAGAGRSSDPALRAAVEQHAVRLASDHMRDVHGWSHIAPLGKPFDLVCLGPAGEKHVEVKGTSGAGGTVEYTTNEVDHFRNCPFGADLIVVREIRVDRTTTPYGTSGGELHHVENYIAPTEDLQPTKYNGRVPR